MNRQTNKHHRDIRLREPTNKREALKLALLCAITAPDHELEKRERCIQWAGELALELGDEVTESVKAEVSAELNQKENNEKEKENE
tara:strand:- start:4184 stop:4441 length:258 start_codon:yes stop_codon:yes gene_type:complete